MGARKAGGLDGWCSSEYRAIAPFMMDPLATLFNLIEETGQWPIGLAVGYIALAPKGRARIPCPNGLSLCSP